MNLLAAIAIAFVLLASPLTCAAMPCDFGAPSHDCCPKSPGKNTIACPYDVLDRAKAAHAPVIVPVAMGAADTSFYVRVIAAVDRPRVDLDFRNLHDRICVLRL
jgi:hypothetical protein